MKERTRAARKIREGVVVSNKMQKTVIVSVSHAMRHPDFEKVVMREKKYYAHIEDSQSVQLGQKVRITETRPLSRLKRWRVDSVIS